MDQVIQNNPRERPFRKSPVRHVYLGSQGPLKPHNIDNLARHYGWSGSGAATNFYRILLPSSQTRRTDDGSLVAAKDAITYADSAVTARNHLDGQVQLLQTCMNRHRVQAMPLVVQILSLWS